VRLNEAGLLSKVQLISSVSGGSITAGLLASQWDKLGDPDPKTGVFENLKEVIVDPLRALAYETIDSPAVIHGMLLPGYSSSDFIVEHYEKYFRNVNLNKLPEKPVFVLNATSLQTGENWQFTKNVMGDQKVVGLTRKISNSLRPLQHPAHFLLFSAPLRWILRQILREYGVIIGVKKGPCSGWILTKLSFNN